MKEEKPDLIIAGIVLALLMISLIMVYSAKLYVDQSYLGRQASRIGLGLIALGAGFFPSAEFWKKGWRVGLLLVVLAIVLAVTLKRGALVHGARRTLFGIQFSEFARPALVIFLAWYYGRAEADEDRPSLWRFVLRPALVCAFIIGLIAFEPAVSMALLVGMLLISLLYLAEVRWLHLALVVLLAVAGGGAAVAGKSLIARFRPPAAAGHAAATTTPLTEHHSIFQHIEDRMIPYVQRSKRMFSIRASLREKSPGDQQIDWQQKQSWIAIGSGGFLGKGLGNGKQKFYFLPMVATDFIFALIGEEWGFIGTLVIFGLFFVFLMRGLSLAGRTPDRFSRLLMAGLVLMVVYNAVVHLFVALHLAPPTGQTLPFVSYGSSALAANMFGVGLLLRLSSQVMRRPVENDLVSRCWNWWAHLSGARAR
jgi:cell division protein FtsW